MKKYLVGIIIFYSLGSHQPFVPMLPFFGSFLQIIIHYTRYIINYFVPLQSQNN